MLRGIDSVKKIYKTTDGGNEWTVIFENDYNIFRSIVFKDSLNGFIGTLDNDHLIRTTDGGLSWYKINSIFGSEPKGICGLYILDSLNIFGCGRYNGPAHFISSTDGGNNWYSKDLSDYASLLVDCYFFDRSNGILVGGKYSEDYNDSYPVVLNTSDGGTSWSESYIGDKMHEIFWKIHFISIETGFLSIQSFEHNSDNISYLKTTNKGISWTKKNVQIKPGWYEELGIIFINNKSGMIGGMRILDNGEVKGESYYTTNEGDSWQIYPNCINVNRLRKVNGKVFASGKFFYKITLP